MSYKKEQFSENFVEKMNYYIPLWDVSDKQFVSLGKSVGETAVVWAFSKYILQLNLDWTTLGEIQLMFLFFEFIMDPSIKMLFGQKNQPMYDLDIVNERVKHAYQEGQKNRSKSEHPTMSRAVDKQQMMSNHLVEY